MYGEPVVVFGVRGCVDIGLLAGSRRFTRVPVARCVVEAVRGGAARGSRVAALARGSCVKEPLQRDADNRAPA